MIAVLVTLDANPGRGDALAALVAALAVHSRQEPGCVRWDWFRSLELPERFVLCEVFADDAAFQAHKATDHVATWKADSAELVARKESARFEPGP